MLSDQDRTRLAWEDGVRKPQTPGQILELFQAAGLPGHLPVARAFAEYGGGRFCLVDSLDTPVVRIDRFKTRYTILFVTDVIRALKPVLKRHPDRFTGADDPARFRILFAEADRCHEAFTLDGFGQVYEAGDQLAPSLGAWLEALGRR